MAIKLLAEWAGHEVSELNEGALKSYLRRGRALGVSWGESASSPLSGRGGEVLITRASTALYVKFRLSRTFRLSGALRNFRGIQTFRDTHSQGHLDSRGHPDS